MARKNLKNVDIIETLRGIVKKNTELYEEDFKLDVDFIQACAASEDEDDKEIFWMSRKCGTNCAKAIDVLDGDSFAHDVWLYYGELGDTSVKAYAVHITGMKDDKVMGDIHRLNYKEHCAYVKNAARRAA